MQYRKAAKIKKRKTHRVDGSFYLGIEFIEVFLAV